MSTWTWKEIKNRVMNKKFLKYLKTISSETNPWSRTRHFGKKEKVRVELFRDHHAWCPYCQKVWLFLEEKQIPYNVSKVTMFCYGEKEKWYTNKISNRGMLPAIKLDGKVITESDVILEALERTFGSLHRSMLDPNVKRLRDLERVLFRAWCSWLCYESRDFEEEMSSKSRFIEVAKFVDRTLGENKGPFFLGSFSIVDVVFVPYVERMNASLFYYKGFLLRDEKEFPNLSRWFDALEKRSTYRGMQSDFHTHVHDLPPQMGGCYEPPPLGGGDDHDDDDDHKSVRIAQRHVLEGPWNTIPDAKYSEPEMSRELAAFRVMQHRKSIVSVNPTQNKDHVDEALRCVVMRLLSDNNDDDGSGSVVVSSPPRDSDLSLRYIRDRINVPRDMPIWSARRLRQACEDVARKCGNRRSVPISSRHRRDQNPVPFGHGGVGSEFRTSSSSLGGDFYVDWCC